MLYLLWALLNVGLFIFFVIICFNAAKLTKEKSGVLAAIVFVFGLLSFVGKNNSDNDNMEPNSNQIKIWKFNSPDSLNQGSNTYTIIDLEKTSISKYSLGISYGKDKELKNTIPISANTFNTGFQSGTSWKPTSIIINGTDDSTKFEYKVDGTVNWNLLGMRIFAQPKHWKGIAVLR